MMDNDSTKLLYRIALTKINGIGDVLARNLMDVFGDEELIFKANKKELLSAPGISNILVSEIMNPDVLRKAEKELLFVEKNNIQTFFYKDEDYPARLRECVDAPVLLYYKGNTDLNAAKIISIVGTRKSTSYGVNFCDNFLEAIADALPEALIVSGLAYGIDVAAHRASLKSKLPTVGVLAHGLDRIYPSAHRQIAMEMMEQGGLLTEFPHETEPDKFNFVRRNRIVAGTADAVIVVQTGMKGGSLITAELANSYNKDVFSVPGRITDNESAGCNMLIEQNKAVLLQSAETFIRFMQWDVTKNVVRRPQQRQLFLDLADDEQCVYDLLSEAGSLHLNSLANQTGVPVSALLSTLLTMEMKGIIKTMVGNIYRLS